MNSHVWLCRDLGEALAGVTAEVVLLGARLPRYTHSRSDAWVTWKARIGRPGQAKRWGAHPERQNSQKILIQKMRTKQVE